MKSFTAAEIGQLCNDNEAAAHQISEHIRWDFEQWLSKLRDHIDRPRAQDCVPNLEQRQIEQVDILNLTDFTNDESVHSVDAAAIIALTVQTHVLGHVVNWLETLKIDEQKFPEAMVLRWCKRNNLKFLDDRCAPAQTPAPLVQDATTRKKWTPEKLAELKAYREKNGTGKAAAHFKITTGYIRQLLPVEKPKSEGHSVFTHRIKDA